MFKSISKIFLLFVLMLCIAAASGYITYIVTVNMLKNNTAESIQTTVERDSVKATADSRGAETGDVDSVELDYYVVRLDGKALGVYASFGGREEFLYNESVYINDLSADDVQLLENGVRLENSSELTGFIENFTS